LEGETEETEGRPTTSRGRGPDWEMETHPPVCGGGGGYTKSTPYCGASSAVGEWGGAGQETKEGAAGAETFEGGKAAGTSVASVALAGSAKRQATPGRGAKPEPCSVTAVPPWEGTNCGHSCRTAQARHLAANGCAAAQDGTGQSSGRPARTFWEVREGDVPCSHEGT
jgi:hypothetical protein